MPTTPRDVPVAFVAMTAPLIDEFLPEYDVRERHATVVRSGVQDAYAAIWRADLGRPLVVRLLLVLRALPALLWRGGLARAVREERDAITLHAFERAGFRVLAAAPPRELVIGLEGRFWTPAGDLRRDLDAERFRGSMMPGTARAAWNFTVTPLRGGGCLLATETRVRCADGASRRRFRSYWLVVRPWSGLIRRMMLREIRREAEARAREHPSAA